MNGSFMPSPSTDQQHVGTTPASNASMNHEAATVCCGCRPAPRRRLRRVLSGTFSTRLTSSRTHRYHDSSQDGVDLGVVVPQSHHEHVEPANDDGDDDELFFFDACENPLAEDEYPYISITDYSNEGDDSFIQRPALRRHVSEPINSYKSRSERFLTLTSRSIEEHQVMLQHPRVKIPQRGFPGDLTMAELGECFFFLAKFLSGLNEMDPGVCEQVYSFRDIEEVPYTICRWLRATKFEASTILQRLQDNQAQFEAARDQEFFPNVSKGIGVPFSVFLSQYPFLPVGRGKNGCPVNYFQAGRVKPEGILSLTTPERLEGYFWWSFMWKFKEEIRKAQELDADFVCMEGINVIDLHGLSFGAAISSASLEIIKLASKIGDFFPETLHYMLIINAPSFFSIAWDLIKKFIDPRTAQRIRMYSNSAKGLAALRELVEEKEIPEDYGGTNKSLKEAFVEEASDPLLKRQDIELVYVKRRGIVSLPSGISLNPDECMEIRVYTRSSTSANVTVTISGTLYTQVQAKNGGPGSIDAAADLLPHCTVIVGNLLGPGSVSIQVEDLDDGSTDKKGRPSRGYFLVVCDVRAKE